MRKFTLLLSAAFLTFAASAAGLNQYRATGIKTAQTHRATAAEIARMQRFGNTDNKLDTRILENEELARKYAPQGKRFAAGEDAAEDLAPITSAPVLEVPAGEVANYSRDCGGYLTFWGMVFAMLDNGSAVKGVKADDGAFWYNNPVSQFPLQSWVKATPDASGNLSIAAGQAVYTEEYEGETYTYYLVPLEFVITNEEEESGWYYPNKDKKSYNLTLKDGKYVSAGKGA